MVVHSAGFLVFVVFHSNIERLDGLLSDGLEGGVGAGKRGVAITHSESL